MDLEIAKLIVEQADELGLEITLYENYSGRGMYGTLTTGLVGSINQIISCAVATAGNLDPIVNEELIEKMTVEFSGIRTDNMAMEIIVY